MITKKYYSEKEFEYDEIRKLYLNPNTNKWVKRPREKEVFNSKFEYYKYDQIYPFANNEEETERINLFLTKLSQRYRKHYKGKEAYSLFDMGVTDYSGYVYAQFTIYETRQLLGRNNQYLISQLIDKNIIEKVPMVNKHGYEKITFKPNILQSVRYERSKIKYHRIHNSLEIYYGKQKKKLGDLLPLIEMVSKFEINISVDEYTNAIKLNYPNYIEECKYFEEDYVAYEEYLKTALVTYNRIVEYNKHKSIIDRLEYFSCDTFSGRFHSIFTQVPSNIRKNISDLNKRIDVQQMQLLLAGKIFKDEIGTSEFFNDVNKDDLYDLIQEKLGIPDRKLAKQYMYHLLFGKIWIKTKHRGWFKNSYHEKFKELYPIEAEYLEKIKLSENELKKPHAIFSLKLQEFEVKIFRQIWSKLLEYKIVFVPVHDEVIYHSDNEKEVVGIFHEVFEKELGEMNYKFKIESL